MIATIPEARPGARRAGFVLILGLYLSIHGYRSLDGDQAFRLPLLLHRQDPSLFADDPFVRAFDAFNPHVGYLALLDGASRLLGLSGALAGLYALMAAATCAGLDRLARSTWPEAGIGIGVVAVGLVLLARAGNVGTNHLFEPLLLDRGIGFGLGWIALGSALTRPGPRRWVAPTAIGLAACVHPSIGLQLAILLSASSLGWAWLGPRRGGVGVGTAIGSIGILGLALVPCLAIQAGQGGMLFRGLPPDEFRILSVEVQGPQHMLPHLWQTPQWLAWACYPALAALAIMARGLNPDRSPARVRLAVLLTANLLGLGLAWIAVEGMGDLRVTVFQPFRLATVARGLALIALADRVQTLATRGDAIGRARALLLGVGLTGDWSLVIVTFNEFAITAAEAIEARLVLQKGRLGPIAGALVLGLGCLFLTQHDTEAGHERIVGALAIWAGSVVVRKVRGHRGPVAKAPTIRRHRLAAVVAIAWAVPVAGMLAAWTPIGEHLGGRSLVVALADRCRFGEVPVDDVERLAVWCRSETPTTARFIGPPGPKTFRLWSRRSLAFNRAASPYHAEGLADWAARFRDHVGFVGSTADFRRAYLDDRQALERGFGAMDDVRLAGLARRQGASHIVAGSSIRLGDGSPIERLHVEGRYAVYRVRPGAIAVRDRAGVRAE